ncbi:SH3 domain-containing protein [Leisingera daeponensis]|uniref:SH3 domain-containing protein n=1 Tax=Leisingera daeponensis TaxID=405746 RepID=UPI003CCB825D
MTGVTLDDLTRRYIGDPIVSAFGLSPSARARSDDLNRLQRSAIPLEPSGSQLQPNGTAEARWENYGAVASEFPNTHYISKDINRLNIRNGPGTDYKIVGGRNAGSCIRVLQTRGSWSKVVVSTAGGPWAYYASNKYLLPIRPSQRCE